MSLKTGSLLAALLLAGALANTASAANDGKDSAKSIDNPNGCKIVERKPGENDSSGSLSTSVTAGNGQVSARSTGGHGVTVQSGNGSVSSSISTTGSGSNSTAMVTTSDGNCVIYVNPGEKKDSKHD